MNRILIYGLTILLLFISAAEAALTRHAISADVKAVAGTPEPLTLFMLGMGIIFISKLRIRRR